MSQYQIFVCNIWLFQPTEEIYINKLNKDYVFHLSVLLQINEKYCENDERKKNIFFFVAFIKIAFGVYFTWFEYNFWVWPSQQFVITEALCKQHIKHSFSLSAQNLWRIDDCIRIYFKSNVNILTIRIDHSMW